MGFGTIAASIVMFIAVLTLSTGVYMTMKADMAEQQDAMREQTSFLSNNLKTDISIQNVGYDPVGNKTLLSLRNTGKTKLSIDYIDVFIDLDFIPRTDENRTLIIDPSTDTRNVGIWDPNEVVLITIPKDLPSGERIIKVAVQYGVYAEDTFSVTYP